MSDADSSMMTPEDLVLNYIAQHAQNGQVQASLRDIEAATGLHYSTVSRVSSRLASENIVRILPRTTAREPSTIQLVSKIDDIDFALINKSLAAIEQEIQKIQRYVIAQNKRIQALETRNGRL